MVYICAVSFMSFEEVDNGAIKEDKCHAEIWDVKCICSSCALSKVCHIGFQYCVGCHGWDIGDDFEIMPATFGKKLWCLQINIIRWGWLFYWFLMHMNANIINF